MGEVAVRQAILHAAVAAAFVEAVLWSWDVRRPEARLSFWLLALAFPLLVLPLLLVAAPSRLTDQFAAASALFASRRWNAVRLADIGLDSLGFAVLAGAGTLLFLRDVVPFVGAAVSTWRHDAEPRVETPPDVSRLVADVASVAGPPEPAVTVLATDTDLLFVRGVWRPTLVLSATVLARLTPAERRAAIAHELAHVRLRDPLAGWALMIVRLVMFWNPAVQLVSRAIVQEMELRADRVAAALAGGPVLAGALRTLAAHSAVEDAVPSGVRRPADADSGPDRGAGREARSPVTPTAPRAGGARRRIEVLAERLHHAHISLRVDSVLAPSPVLPFVRARLALLAVALGALLFFVV